MAVRAVTGDIGAGKSTVTRLLARKLGCEVQDADEIAHSLWETQEVITAAKDRWGSEILDTSGNIIKAKISDIIFSDEEEYKFCNTLLHPLVMSKLRDISRNSQSIILEIPLLFEAGRPCWIDEVIYVTAPFRARAVRCSKQRGWSESELAIRERLLMPQEVRMSMSDIIIYNDGGLDELEAYFASITSLRALTEGFAT